MFVVATACSLHPLDYLGAGGAPSATAGQAADAGGGDSARGGAGGNGGTGGLNTAGLTGEAGMGGTDTPPPHCDDFDKNGDETDVDCGGRICEPCLADRTCAVGTDCQSAICTNVVCQPPSCTDLALNGQETDVNCGGSCPPCAQGKHCAVDDDCSTGNCAAGICESTATCSEDVLRAGCPLLVDNTPYSLSPATALANCVDDDQDSVSEGNAMRLHPCKSELRQTFWAVARADGHFAFRSALSGKCLHVRDASTAGGAVIEQSTCSFASDQLWKPIRVDSSVMKLTSKSSGLALNVDSGNAGNDGQPIIQGQVDESADTDWRITRRTTASYIAFSPDAERALQIQHDSAIVALGADNRTSAHWIVVPGLSDASLVSFQSRNDPGRYLRHASYRLWSDTNDGTPIFKRDATFRYRQPLVGSDQLAKALEASNYSGLFLIRDGAIVSLAAASDSPEYRASATWRLVAR